MTRLCRTSKCFLKLLAGLAMILLACISVMSCKSPAPMIQVVERNTHDTIVLFDTKYDSIFHTDSVYEYVYIKGDTVVRDKVKSVVKYKYSTKHDSIYVNMTDTIEKPVYIEKKLSDWQAFKLRYAGKLLLGFLVALLLLLISLFIKRHFTS